MALSQAVAAPIEKILGSVELAPRNGFHLEPRCRVCRNNDSRTKDKRHASCWSQLRHDPTGS